MEKISGNQENFSAIEPTVHLDARALARDETTRRLGVKKARKPPAGGRDSLGPQTHALGRSPCEKTVEVSEELSHGVLEGSNLSIGSVLGGRYRIEKQIGMGASATVYRCRDLLVEGHTVALKLMHSASHDEDAK